MNAAQQRRLTPVLVIAAVLLGAALLLLASGVGRRVRWGARRSMPPLPQASVVDLPRTVPLSQYALVWQKPLFNPDRKPVARMVDGGSNLGDLELTGIILTPRLRMALLHDKNGDRQVRLREGESLPDGSVRLVEIRPRSAVFDASNGRTELKLPAGAPIDVPKSGADAAAREAPGDATLRIVQGAQDPVAQPGDGNIPPPRREPARKPRPGLDHPEEDTTPGAIINRLRQNIQRRRANAAAAHEGVR